MDIVYALLSPIGFGVPLALLLWWSRKRAPRAPWRIGMAIEIACIVFSTPLGANTLVRWQEDRVSLAPTCTAPEPNAVVLLTASARRVPRQPGDIDTLSASSLRRTLIAARLARRLPDAQLIVTGTSDKESAPVSVVMAQLAIELGVPAASIRTEVAARTTWENARNVRALKPALPQRVWLVTSALHMPRSMIAFRAAGFEPCAFPSDRMAVPFGGVADLLPSGGAASETEAVVHEWIGEIVYRLRVAFG